MKYSHSDNEETFHGEFDSEEEAIAAAFEEYDDADVVYVGECHKRTIGRYLQQSAVVNLLDSIAEVAGDDCGEAAEGWLQEDDFKYIQGESPTDRTIRVKAWREKEKERLAPLLDGFKAALEAWATDQGCQPRFWHVENVKSFDRDEI